MKYDKLYTKITESLYAVWEYALVLFGQVYKMATRNSYTQYTVHVRSVVNKIMLVDTSMMWNLVNKGSLMYFHVYVVQFLSC
jgi:hypothetical protein